MESLVFGSFGSPSLFLTGGNYWRSNAVKSGPFPSCSSLDILERCYSVRFQCHHVKHHFRSSEKIFQGKGTKVSVNASSGHPLESEPGTFDPNGKNALDAFYRFSRPHTIIGTALSIVSVSLLAVEKISDLSPIFFTGVFQAIAAALMMNIYIVGLNQLYDIEIDKSFWLGWFVGSWPLILALSISFILGTAYSINLPLLRWKRFALIAAMCILAVRAVIVQLAFYLHMQIHVFKRPPLFSRALIFATAFMSFFSVVIALFKDIPDIDGDMTFGIQSFTVRLGQKRVFWICISLLEIAYGVSTLVGGASLLGWSKYIMVLGHSILALVLWNRANSVDLKSKVAITSCYMFIWKLFYAEYLLIPFIR
ncbi:homogentisate phytyltransferase 1, chloroplastic-like isoform X2 [Tripterygium wilfordii]|uniref:homogentisate phytyltransferase 1, chloroplastic-like isoform X2 n=1 Tax=Tripterygium wilfordii TaxID=458696 RepID=UPI0018F8384F|nr:homogentisate phytyltransferase 1, chloroplastic-like isoform X2 [Tripterygium wilfordii]